MGRPGCEGSGDMGHGSQRLTQEPLGIQPREAGSTAGFGLWDLSKSHSSRWLGKSPLWGVTESVRAGKRCGTQEGCFTSLAGEGTLMSLQEMAQLLVGSGVACRASATAKCP